MNYILEQLNKKLRKKGVNNMLFGKDGNFDNHEEFKLTTEAMSNIMEAAILDTVTPEEIQAFLENHTEVQTALKEQVLLEKTIVRLDKKARLSRAQKMAVFEIAKQKNDPKFKKLLTIWRMERYLENFLMKKYGNQAMRMARQAMRSGGKSKSNLIKKVADNIHKQLNTPIKQDKFNPNANITIPGMPKDKK